MKYIKTLNEISGYDSWKTQSPYDYDEECMSSGEVDFDVSFNIDKKANSDAIPGKEFKAFVSDIDKILMSYFKKHKQISNLKVYSPLNQPDESYIDWVENEDGTYSIGSIAWKITGEIEEVSVASEDVIAEISPSEKDLAKTAKKYKWIDLNKIWIEDIDSEINNDCE